MSLQSISYHADDTQLTGFLADGSRGAPAPGILVAHESLGVTAHVKARAKSLAELGYVALALDLFGARNLDLEDARHHGTEIMTTPNLLYTRERGTRISGRSANGGLERLAAIGFCLGGVAALELARHRAPIRCAIGFHPGLKRVAGSPEGAIAAKVLMMVTDPIVRGRASPGRTPSAKTSMAGCGTSCSTRRSSACCRTRASLWRSI